MGTESCMKHVTSNSLRKPLIDHKIICNTIINMCGKYALTVHRYDSLTFTFRFYEFNNK